jgi:predicted nucleotidyltransferase
VHLSNDLREFVALLNSKRVEYLIVGAYAVAWHGYPRFTADIDLLIRPSPANAEALVTSLNEFGFASLHFTPEDFIKPGQIVQLGVKPNRIDLITSIAGVEFDQAWAGRVGGEIDGIPVQFVGLEELITNKESTGRLKDQADAEELRKRRPRV